MPTATYTPLANITLGSNATSVTFSSISQSYRDLVLVLNGNIDNAQPFIGINGTTNVYYSVWANGDGATLESGTASTSLARGRLSSYTATSTANLVTTINIMDYSATDKHKTILYRTSMAGIIVEMGSIRWTDTSAVTSVDISANSQNWLTGSTFALYGIAA